MSWATFILKLSPHLVSLGRALYRRYGGDLERAVDDISFIRDHGAKLDHVRAQIDRELAELRAQGK